MGGHMFELPEDSNDQTKYSKTIDELKELIKTVYKETYLEIARLFTEPTTQPTAKRPPPLWVDATEDDENIRNKKLNIYTKKTDEL